MTSLLEAFRDGIGRVWRAPAILGGLFVLTLLMAIPPGLVLESRITEHLGNSRAADTALSGVNMEWWQEFSEQADGLAKSFSPSVIGFAAVLDNLSRVLDNGAMPGPVFWLAAVYLLVWLFLAGGVIDRYARVRAIRTQAFFAASGVYFVRFLRLAIIAGTVYWLLFTYVHAWLLDDFYRWATRDMTVERSAFSLRLALYLLFGSLVVGCSVVFDYAKIRAVVEDRRSMIGALVAALRFVLRRPGATMGLYLMNGACFAAVVAAYAFAAPGARSIWLAFAIGQAYVLARLFVKLLFLASQTALFQGTLAHAAYTASPQPAWPESASAEAIANAVKTP